MKKIALLSVLVFSYCFTLAQIRAATDSFMMKTIIGEGFDEPPNYYFKKFSALSLDGKAYSDDSLKNKITFINFWFETCVPCVAEFDALNKLYDQYKTNPNFLFLSFTFEPKETAQLLAAKYHLTYPVIYLQKDDIYKLNFYLGFPTTIITDRNEKVRLIKCGGPNDRSNAEKELVPVYRKKIETLLSQP